MIADADDVMACRVSSRQPGNAVIADRHNIGSAFD
jgi:hypothetical protein